MDNVPDEKLPPTSKLKPQTETSPPTSSGGSHRASERCFNLQRGEALSPRPAVVLWGTGSPRREFLYSDDLADACLFLMNRIEDLFTGKTSLDGAYHLINIGCGRDQTVRELADLVAKVVGFEGGMEWDTTKPDGTPQKLLDVSRLTALGWQPRISLEKGLNLAYQDYLDKSQT